MILQILVYCIFYDSYKGLVINNMKRFIFIDNEGKLLEVEYVLGNRNRKKMYTKK